MLRDPTFFPADGGRDRARSALKGSLIVQEPPDMTSASMWRVGSWKSGRSKGSCVNFMLQISSKCGQGDQKFRKFCGCH